MQAAEAQDTEETNTSRLSLEAPSKFSTRMFLLQRETALMATFHTWFTSSHYSELRGRLC